MVMGNMIGSGIFLLPASLAGYGRWGLIGWGCSAAGAMVLAALFRSLARIRPSAAGGPYAYVREAFGDFMGFTVGWGYWVSIWCTNAAIAVAAVGYIGVFLQGWWKTMPSQRLPVSDSSGDSRPSMPSAYGKYRGCSWSRRL